MVGEDRFRSWFMAARAGDKDARDHLVHALWPSLLGFVHRRAGVGILVRETPDDIAQSAMLTFLERFAGFAEHLDPKAVRARLYQIAKWKMADVLRNRPREVCEGSVSFAERPSSQASRGTVTLTDDKRRLGELIRQMRGPYARTLELYGLEGLSLAKTADRLSLTEEAVRKRLVRARKELKTLSASWRSQERRP